MMGGEEHPEKVALREHRSEVIDRLCAAFADNVLALDEFDRRVETAHALERTSELDELVADLGTPAALVPVATTTLVAASEPAAPPLRMRAASARFCGAVLKVVGFAVFGSIEVRVAEEGDS
jgi:hypothetical protein